MSNKNHVKLKIIIPSLITLTVILLSARAYGKEIKVDETVKESVFEENISDTTYMPFVGNNYCNANIPSPFSLQVAALHQIQPQLSSLTEQEILQAEAEFSKLTDALRESGAAWTRLYIQWFEIEPEAPLPGKDPVYHWSWYDARIEQVAGVGVKPLLTVGVPPYWAAETRCSPIDQLDDFARFLSDLVNRYKQPPYNVQHWELINEPDGVSPDSWTSGWGCWGYDADKYASMLSVAYTAIKNADPQATVLMGGLAYDGFIEYADKGCETCNFNRYFADEVMEHGGGAFFDKLNIHYFADYHKEWERWDPNHDDRIIGGLPAPTCGKVDDGSGLEYYAGDIDITAKINHFRNRMSTCYEVDKPLWLTELAEHGYPEDEESLDNQARYVIAGHARALAAGAENITWYALVTQDGFEQGLLFQDWQPKPSFDAYKTLTSELTGYRYKQTLQGAGLEGYIFTNGCGSDKTVIWGSVTHAFSPASVLRVVDRRGDETQIEDGGQGDIDGIKNGVIQLWLSADPVFVEIVR